MRAFVSLECDGETWRLTAACPDTEVFVADAGLPDTPSSRRAMGELLKYVEHAETIVTYGADELTARLSDPVILPIARRCLQNVCDAQRAALLVAAGLPGFSIETFCEMHHIEPPSVTDPSTFLERWETVALRLRDRVNALSDAAKGLISSVAGPTWSVALLGPPGDPVSAGHALRALLPRRPRRGRMEPLPPPSDLAEVVGDVLSPDGPISKEHDSYEHRPGQIEMAEAVAGALTRDEVLLVEAGTGTGKSLAYLIPAIVHARTQGKPVVVSTNTRNLQDQLIERDIPLAGRALGMEFRAAVVKGRSNYLCPRLMAAAADRAAGSVFSDDRLALAHVIAWSSVVEIADISSMSRMAVEMVESIRPVVRQVQARSDSCSGRSCPYYQTCPVEVARAHAQNADVIVANHALLLASSGTPILPEFEHVIIDEAHNLEDVATDQLGREVTSISTRRLVRALSGEGAEALDGRVLEWLESQPAADPANGVAVQAALAGPTAALDYAFEDFAAAILDFCETAPTDRRGNAQRDSVRLTMNVRTDEPWQAVSAELPNVRGAADEVRAALAILSNAITTTTDEPDDTAVAILLDIEHMRSQFEEFAGTLNIIVEGIGDDEYVCWVSTWTMRGGDPGWGLRAAPVDVGPALAKALYRDASSVILTSATLTVEDSFDYLRQRIGLAEERHRTFELVVPSPFDFANQLLLCIPEDIPIPGEGDFDAATQNALYQAAVAAGGGTLCLFTSRDSMTKAFSALEPRLTSQGLRPLCQDITGPRTSILDTFREDPTSVLFGLKSFWEGIDVPGHALRCLVIAKLPFAVPSDPVVQARQERVQDMGLSGYEDFYIPNAIIGFRQGVGRLIRTATDCGAVYILDRRVVLRRYGERFLNSLPNCMQLREPLAVCAARTQELVARPSMEAV